MDGNIVELSRIWDKIVEIFLSNSKKSGIDVSPFTSKCELVKLDNLTKTAFVVCENEFTKQLFANNYTQRFQEAANDVTNTDWIFRFMLRDEYTTITDIKDTSEFKKVVDRGNIEFDMDTGITGKYTFENYFSNADNQKTARMAKSVAKSPSGQFNPLFIWGRSGWGKTHLLQAIGHYIINNSPNIKVKYISSDEFGALAVDRLNTKENRIEAITNFINKYKNIDLLLMDDIQILSERAKTKDILFQIVDANLNANKQIVFSSDKNPSELPDFEERFTTRFQKGIVLQVQKPDFEASRQILMRMISQVQDFDSDDVDPDVIDYIARNYNSNGRELEGAFNKLLVWSITDDINTKITMDIAKTILQDITKSTDGINIAKVKNTVAKVYGISLEELEGDSRVKQVVIARQVAMYLCRNVIESTLKAIGDSFGSKDHSTVKSSIAKIEKQLKTDELLNKTLETIKDKLRT